MENIKAKNNSVGDLYQIDLKNTTIYNIFTKAGNYRGGKIYSKDKKIIIISGKVKLISNNGKEDIEKIYSSGEIINLSAGMPHIFYFIEDSEMIEYFEKGTKTEIYENYYNLKN